MTHLKVNNSKGSDLTAHSESDLLELFKVSKTT